MRFSPLSSSAILRRVADLNVDLPEAATEASTHEERAAAWLAIAESMAATLDALLASEVYGRDVQGRPAAPKSHGVYLFSDNREHLYVGRTGKTERSVKAGKTSSSGFRARLAGHSRPKAGINSPSFALRLAMEAAAEEGLEVPAKRKATEQRAVRGALHRGEGAHHPDGVPGGQYRGGPRECGLRGLRGVRAGHAVQLVRDQLIARRRGPPGGAHEDAGLVAVKNHRGGHRFQASLAAELGS